MRIKVGNKYYSAETSSVRFCWERKLWRRLFTLLGMGNCNYRVYIGEQGGVAAIKNGTALGKIHYQLGGQKVWKHTTNMPECLAKHIADTVDEYWSMGEVLGHVADKTNFSKYFDPDGGENY